jgi:hypothetical protein
MEVSPLIEHVEKRLECAVLGLGLEPQVLVSGRQSDHPT